MIRRERLHLSEDVEEVAEQQGLLLPAEGEGVWLSSRSVQAQRGFWTLMVREIARFMRIWPQTIVAPLVMALLLYAVFALGGAGPAARQVDGLSFLTFLAPGLVMMAAAQSAFMTPSSALILAKLQGHVVDILMAPLSALTLTCAYAFSGMVRGALVGLVVWGALALINAQVAQALHAGVALAFLCVGAFMVSLMGVLTGILGDRFDHLGAMQNFVILPATFLSGSFFSVEQLPSAWRSACFLNPFFHMIDGFRHALTGAGAVDLVTAMGMLIVVSLVLSTISYWLLAAGTRLKT